MYRTLSLTGAPKIESLRGAVRYLRSENSYLKSQDLLKQLNTLPSYTPLPPAFPPSFAEDDASVSIPDTAFDRARRFASESKALFKEAAALSSRPKVVDLTKAKRSGSGTGPAAWQSRARLPQEQFDRRKEEVERLRKKIEGLRELRTAL